MTRRIGAHVSIAKGMIAALDKAEAMGANCIQIFSSSPRSFDPPNKPDVMCAEFKAASKKRDIGPNFIHATYLINLASGKPDLRQKSVQSLINDLVFADKIGAVGSIVHTGSHVGMGFDSCVDTVVAAIKEILAETPTNTKLFLELAAGGKGKVGSTFEELAILLKGVNHPRVGVCLDTAHMFAGGYAYNSIEDIKKIVAVIDKTIGWEKVACVHTNDSKTDFGSFSDRHENIGKGKIGLAPFKLLLHEPHFSQIPFILEVPGMDGKSGPDKVNLDILKSLL